MTKKPMLRDPELEQLKNELEKEFADAERDIKAGRMLTREQFKADMRRHMAQRIRQYRKTKRQAAE